MTEVAQPDEATGAVRFPSITTSYLAVPGSKITLMVDLTRVADETTQSSGVSVTGLAKDWQKLPIGVEVMSAHLAFEDPTGEVIVVRDSASIPWVAKATVLKSAQHLDRVEVVAVFRYRGQYCGQGLAVIPTSADVHVRQPRRGANGVAVDTHPSVPALTVWIYPATPGSESDYIWRLTVPKQVPGIPLDLTGRVNLGSRAATLAATLFKGCEKLASGQHVETLQGIGEQIYEKTPPCFKESYWALRTALGPSFPIQFISADPYLPWELMRPHRDGEVADILAITHPVGRWIQKYEGGMPHQVGAGRVVTIAPEYQPPNDLPYAQDEATELVADFKAERIVGVYKNVLELLQRGLDKECVSLLHFAGHGEFSQKQAGLSVINLEDTDLTVAAVRRQEIQLGIACHTLVLLNACQVGATASVLGEVGGWADAFAARGFAGFVAPLWSVQDKDAIRVTKALVKKIVTDREPIGKALQEIRAADGALSPTFYSYLYYGDVMAKVR